MRTRIPHKLARWIGGGVLLLVVATAWIARGSWYPATREWVDRVIVGAEEANPNSTATQTDDSDGHGAAALELSDAALRNLGLTSDFIRPIKLTTFRRSITVPAVVVEQPGRTRIQVATPMTGVITHVHAVPGEAIEPGTLLFQIRLTHEDLVQAQTDFLKTLGELDVERQEIKRLEQVTASGAVARRVLLEREYARDKLEALLRAQREALRLHGLTDEQVERIDSERHLLRELQIVAPSPDEHPATELKLSGPPVQQISYSSSSAGRLGVVADAAPLVLSNLNVHKGQSVDAGETLCVLADYGELFIEGLAFEQDAALLIDAARNNWDVAAVIERPGAESVTVGGLRIARLSNEIDVDARTLKFYVRLPNVIERNEIDEEGRRQVTWRYRPGQRMQLRVPVEEWPDQIVLPVAAVVKEGAESFVFQQNGDHFEPVPVHVKYRDPQYAVIANDGALFAGDVVAWRGAHQMLMALRNQSGGAVDPHAGHTHPH